MLIGIAPHRKTALLAALGVGLASLLGCDGGMEAPESAEPTSAPAETLTNTAADLYVASTTLWRPMTVPVCWENPGADATQRQWVRNAVARTWEARSGVRFTGWGTCPASSTGIRINISDVGPHVKALGNGLNGMAQGMVLNFTFNNWSTSCQSQLQFCIDAIAVHEFGHALGYAHEQNRPDRPSTCTEPAQGSSGDWLIGPWDLGSVMNYCNPNWNGNGNLSATDVQGAQLTYGVPWESLGGGFLSGPAVSSWGAGRLDLFGRGQDNQLWHLGFNGAQWVGWEALGGSLNADPAAVSWGANHIDVVGRTTDNSFMLKTWTGTQWSAWASLGGGFNSGPAIASWGVGRLDIFGRGTDNALWHKAWNGSQWVGWYSLGGNLTSDPAAVSWGPNRIDVVARGADNSYMHTAWNGSVWSAWTSLGGGFSSSPGIASWGPGRLDVFGRGLDNQLWINSWNGSGWSGWQWLGGDLTSSPDAVSWGSGRLDIFYRGPDNTMRHSAYSNGW
ncbi:M12 family metallopeptidase [Pyxidicoccus caerfyrddinensis]|uniref:M12 family metallopeptidase n=1 Tax=Pyxidicoccus caerfyrddinensis TaxID=2709663 RepID=UPI0013DB56DE|nr:M12 family metallopeptidase [Pyxidicoccus caerfyrddinensis]